MATVRRTVISEPSDDVVETSESGTRFDSATERRWALDACDVITLLVGLFFTITGILALIELGFTDFPSEATTEVFGLAHTQIWGGISILLGLIALAGVGSIGRTGNTFAGALMLVVGIVALAARESLDAVMATNSAYGWTATILGAVVLLAAIAIPSVARSDRVVGGQRVVEHRL